MSTQPIAGARRPKEPISIPWGWLEWYILLQNLIPGLLYVPGLSSVRVLTRVAAYVIAPLAWGLLVSRGRRAPGDATFPARPWLIFCVIWLALEIFHPNSYSLIAAAAQVTLYVSVLSPAFWAPSALNSSKQLGRVMAVLFLCNALSATLGMAQVFRPQTFNPPIIQGMKGGDEREVIHTVTDDGRRIMRPCGLSDSPGMASAAGVAAALLGLSWSLRPIAVWKRLACGVLAFLGVAVIYYSQVRSAILMLAICVAAMTVLFTIQKNFKQAIMLASGGTTMVVGALLWVARSGGSAFLERFLTLIEGDPSKLMHQSRGHFIEQAFNEYLWDYPLGYGMGWWGMVNAIFGRPDQPSPMWCEVMWPGWIIDGGAPLLIAYVVALGMAMADTLRIAWTSKDRDVAFWAAVIVSFNLSLLASTFSFVPFISAIGIQFWLLSATLHAADARARLAARPAAKAVAR